MRLEIDPRAEAEAERSIVWYAERSERAAREFLEELTGALEQVRAHPMRWPFWRRDIRRITLQQFPFVVFYRASPDLVLVIAVAHAKRRPGYWARRAR